MIPVMMSRLLLLLMMMKIHCIGQARVPQAAAGCALARQEGSMPTRGGPHAAAPLAHPPPPGPRPRRLRRGAGAGDAAGGAMDAAPAAAQRRRGEGRRGIARRWCCTSHLDSAVTLKSWALRMPRIFRRADSCSKAKSYQPGILPS